MEKKRSVGVKLVGLGVIIIFSLVYSLSYSQEVKQSTLKLIVNSNKQIYKQGEPINIDVALKNISKKQIKLFHPDSINKGWFNWGLKCHIIKPNGKKVMLEPNIFYSAVYEPEKGHYKSLAPGDAINIPINFQIKGLNEGAWIALIEISEEEDKKSPEAIRRDYNIKGEFGYGHFRDKDYLLLEDILENVFNSKGGHKLKFQYKN